MSSQHLPVWAMLLLGYRYVLWQWLLSECWAFRLKSSCQPSLYQLSRLPWQLSKLTLWMGQYSAGLNVVGSWL